jgi:EPS-associated MarR family transcriptional regulator
MVERKNHGMLMTEEAHYRLLRLLEQEPKLSQREIAERLGVSLGKVNYCLQALVERGWVKVGNFYRSQNKRAYLYKLTPRGLAEKATLALRFLRVKEAEHRALVREIEALREEVNGNAGGSRKESP